LPASGKILVYQIFQNKLVIRTANSIFHFCEVISWITKAQAGTPLLCRPSTSDLSDGINDALLIGAEVLNTVSKGAIHVKIQKLKIICKVLH